MRRQLFSFLVVILYEKTLFQILGLSILSIVMVIIYVSYKPLKCKLMKYRDVITESLLLLI